MTSQADVDLDKFGSFKTQKVTNLKLQTNCNSSPTVNALFGKFKSSNIHQTTGKI